MMGIIKQPSPPCGGPRWHSIGLRCSIRILDKTGRGGNNIDSRADAALNFHTSTVKESHDGTTGCTFNPVTERSTSCPGNPTAAYGYFCPPQAGGEIGRLLRAGFYRHWCGRTVRSTLLSYGRASRASSLSSPRIILREPILGVFLEGSRVYMLGKGYDLPAAEVSERCQGTQDLGAASVGQGFAQSRCRLRPRRQGPVRRMVPH